MLASAATLAGRSRRSPPRSRVSSQGGAGRSTGRDRARSADRRRAIVSLRFDIKTAERWADSAHREGYGADLARWLRDLADKRAK